MTPDDQCDADQLFAKHNLLSIQSTMVNERTLFDEDKFSDVLDNASTATILSMMEFALELSELKSLILESGVQPADLKTSRQKFLLFLASEDTACTFTQLFSAEGCDLS